MDLLAWLFLIKTKKWFKKSFYIIKIKLMCFLFVSFFFSRQKLNFIGEWQGRISKV